MQFTVLSISANFTTTHALIDRGSFEVTTELLHGSPWKHMSGNLFSGGAILKVVCYRLSGGGGGERP